MGGIWTFKIWVVYCCFASDWSFWEHLCPADFEGEFQTYQFWPTGHDTGSVEWGEVITLFWRLGELVGGLVAIFYFPINIGLLIIPIDFHIFQKGGPTTNQRVFFWFRQKPLWFSQWCMSRVPDYRTQGPYSGFAQTLRFPHLPPIYCICMLMFMAKWRF